MSNDIIHYIYGGIFTVGFALTLLIAYRKNRLHVPTTKTDVLRRSVVRLGTLAVPYLVVAWLWSFFRGDNVLFHGFWFWFAVVLIPGTGLVLDLWMLKPDPKQ